jgi:hypothetical protein
MHATVLGLIWAVLSTGVETPSYLCQPSYALDDVVRTPLELYIPQPGDIFLASDKALWSRVGHCLVGGPGVHHSGVIFALPGGGFGLIEAGPFNKADIRVVDPWSHMATYMASGERVWVRRRRVPLTPEQSARLTAFALAQNGKPFAITRMLRQVTPFRTRGPIRIYFMGRPQGSRDRFFCSELAIETCVAAGLLDPETARPSATYPREIFSGRSLNPYIDRHLIENMEPGWYPPARWLPHPLPGHGSCSVTPASLLDPR